MRTVRRLLLILLVPFLGMVAAPPTEALSCIGPESAAAGSTTLFTGRIRDYRDERFLVEVDEVWRGSVTPEVWLATELGYWSDLKAFRSGTIPDGYSSEKVFLFAPHERTGHPTVSVCTMWESFTPWGQDLKQFRPAIVRQPRSLPSVIEPERADAPISRSELRRRQVIAGAAVIVVLGGGIILVRRRRQGAAPGQAYSPETRPEDY